MTTSTRHLFVMDPAQNLNLAWDTTIKIAFMLARGGAEVSMCTLPDLVMNSHPTLVSANASRMRFTHNAASLSLATKDLRSFSSFDLVHMRKEPPYDLAYIEALWLLNYGQKQTKVWNDPIALQQINEKLIVTEFPEVSTPAIIGSDPKVLATWAEVHCHGDVIVKPLNLFGGRGVVHLSDLKTLYSDLDRETSGGCQTRILQKFDSRISDGEVRAFVVSGVPVGWCLKVPGSGGFLANTRAGSTLHEHHPNAAELNAVTTVSAALKARGVEFAGFDLIDGRISEVNITCPAILNPVRESLQGIEQTVSLILAAI
ncbi:MAG: hypothetical protein NTV34_19625 [Proteobacteria bacterium]|nr:hypothetical protein [Pseudomonadota bacterium]